MSAVTVIDILVVLLLASVFAAGCVVVKETIDRIIDEELEKSRLDELWSDEPTEWGHA